MLKPRADTTRARIKEFVETWVDLSHLPDESARKVRDNDLVPWRESKGRIIRTHQFRKMFAGFALDIDERLLPVLQLHFHHLSEAMTETGYWGRNRLQVEPLSTVGAQRTNLWLYEMATGRSLSSGKMADHVSNHLDALRERLSGKSTVEGWREVVEFTNDNDLRMWFSFHGNCLPLHQTEMRCNVVGKTTSWLNRSPNFTVREPSLCLGCRNFVVDARHLSFWTERYIENQVSWLRATESPVGYRAIRERAAQARTLLTRLGKDVGVLDQEVSRRLKAGRQ